MSELSQPKVTPVESTGARSQLPHGRRYGRLGTLARLSLGAGLLAVEALGIWLDQWADWLEQSEQEPSPALPEEASAESVLIPAAEWETIPNQPPEPSAGHALLGLILATQDSLSQAGSHLRHAQHRAGRRMGRAAQLLQDSRALAPVKGRFQTLVERGQAEVARWREAGRAEEARSRALAQAAFAQLVDTSMDLVVEDPRMQVFIQEVVQEQSRGMLDEVIEETRERTVSSDMLLERKVRAWLRRPPRESLPVPTAIIAKLAKPKARGRE